MMLPSRSKNLNIAIQKNRPNSAEFKCDCQGGLIDPSLLALGAFDGLFAGAALVGIPCTVSSQVLDGAFPYSR